MQLHHPIRKILGKIRRRVMRGSHASHEFSIPAAVEVAPYTVEVAPFMMEPPPPVEPCLTRMMDSLEQTPENETTLVAKLMASYTAARAKLPSVSDAYLPSPNWGGHLDANWGSWRETIARGDDKTLAHLLRNLFRNEGIGGFWGGSTMFELFRDADYSSAINRAALMMAQFNTWQRLLPALSVDELNAPRIGNPWGYMFGNNVLYEPVFEYSYQAHYFRSLLSPLKAPVVLEIGGGFGGLGYHILKAIPSAKYIALDLPENVVVQAYYLACAFPRAKVLVYDDKTPTLDRSLIDAHDIILMPNFMLPEVPSSAIDLIVNSRSLSEMSAGTIAEYLRQIDRIGRLWFFHENIYKDRCDGLHGIPSVRFPKLQNHLLVAESESRWPRYNSTSAYPCQENLFLHRRVLS